MLIKITKLKIFNNFQRKLTADFKMVFFGRVVINSASQLIGLFLPIFLYKFLDMNLFLVIAYYLLLDFLYLNFIIIGCRQIMNRVGIKRSLQISIIFVSLYYAFLLLLDKFFVLNNSFLGINFIWWLIPAVLFSLMFRLTYWVPFHTNMAELTDRRIRASQLSLMEATMMVLGAIMPIIAGLVLSSLGFSYLFLMTLLIFLLSIIPFSFTPKIEEKFSWTYKKTWKVFFSKKFRKNVISYMGDGAESIVGIVIWPIFIWKLLEGDYLQIGLISSVIIVATIVLQLLVGGLIDKSTNRNKWLRYGSFFYSIGWIFKVFISGALQIFIFSTYHNISRIFSRTSFDTLNYDIASNQGHYVDEYNVIREMAIMLGKIIMGLIIIVIAPFLPLSYIFLLAALASLSMSLLSVNKK